VGATAHSCPFFPFIMSDFTQSLTGPSAPLAGNERTERMWTAGRGRGRGTRPGTAVRSRCTSTRQSRTTTLYCTRGCTPYCCRIQKKSTELYCTVTVKIHGSTAPAPQCPLELGYFTLVYTEQRPAPGKVRDPSRHGSLEMRSSSHLDLDLVATSILLFIWNSRPCPRRDIETSPVSWSNIDVLFLLAHHFGKDASIFLSSFAFSKYSSSTLDLSHLEMVKLPS